MTVIPDALRRVAPPPLLAANFTINYTSLLQPIAGFGGADTYLGPLSTAQADLFFSSTPGVGIGLSILKCGIDPTGNTMGDWANPPLAAARGAIVIAAPWTGPAAYKSNNNLNGTGSNANDDGAYLLTADYSAWATIMAGFQATMVANGGPNIYAISVQEEPDYDASYAAMTYSPAQMAAFIDVLGPKLAALSPAPLLMLPETAGWGNVAGFTSAVAGDSTAKSYAAIVAAHQYGGVSAPDGNLPALPIWQTEMSYFNSFDASMTNGLQVAQDIYTALTTGGASAWCYWWLVRTNQADNEALIDTTTMTKRYYTLGNYSLFVRPGFSMISVTGSVSGVYLTAFRLPGTGRCVIVAVNTNGGPTTITISLNGGSASQFTPWLTDATHNLAAQAVIPVASTFASVTLAATSVTTLVSA